MRRLLALLIMILSLSGVFGSLVGCETMGEWTGEGAEEVDEGAEEFEEGYDEGKD